MSNRPKVPPPSYRSQLGSQPASDIRDVYMGGLKPNRRKKNSRKNNKKRHVRSSSHQEVDEVEELARRTAELRERLARLEAGGGKGTTTQGGRGTARKVRSEGKLSKSNSMPKLGDGRDLPGFSKINSASSASSASSAMSSANYFKSNTKHFGSTSYSSQNNRSKPIPIVHSSPIAPKRFQTSPIAPKRKPRSTNPRPIATTLSTSPRSTSYMSSSPRSSSHLSSSPRYGSNSKLYSPNAGKRKDFMESTLQEDYKEKKEQEHRKSQMIRKEKRETRQRTEKEAALQRRDKSAFQGMEGILANLFQNDIEAFSETAQKFADKIKQRKKKKRSLRPNSSWTLDVSNVQSYVTYKMKTFLSKIDKLDDDGSKIRSSRSVQALLGKKKGKPQGFSSFFSASSGIQSKRVIHLYLVEATNLQPSKIRQNLLNAYCKVYLISLQKKTEEQAIRKFRESINHSPAIVNTLNPVWDYMLTMGFQDETDCIVVDVYDQMGDYYNGITDPLLGRICIPLEKIIENNTTLGNSRMIGCQKWFPLFSKDLSSRSCGQVNIRLAIDNNNQVDALFETQSMIRSIPAPNPTEETMSLFIGSWNCGNAGPPDDLAPWISVGTHDLYVIGSQECKFKPREGFKDCKDDWRAHLVRHFGREYTLASFKNYWEIRVAIFVRNSLKHRISGITSHVEATGIGNVLGNKGGRLIALFWNQTPLGFCNSHLAAHTGFTEARNQNARLILKKSKLGLPRPGSKGPIIPSTCNQFDYFFFFGDMNYRLEFFDKQDTNKPSFETHNRIVQNVELDGGRKGLFAHDQLYRSMKKKKVFFQFEEGNPWEFRPTFKMLRFIPFEYTTQRAPAWTDRILWRKLKQKKNFELISYTSAEGMLTSDHKPVLATFTIPVTSLPSGIDPKTPRFMLSINTIRATGLRMFVTAEQEQRSFVTQASACQVRKAFNKLDTKLKERSAQLDTGFVLQFYASFLPCALVSLSFEDTWAGVYHPSTAAEMQSMVDKLLPGTRQRLQSEQRAGEKVDVKINNIQRILSHTVWVQVMQAKNVVAHGAIDIGNIASSDNFRQKEVRLPFLVNLDNAGTESGSLKGELMFSVKS